MTRYVGVDIGGTNTDLIFLDEKSGQLVTAKVPTTAANQADGLIEGAAILGVPLASVDLLIHGTTVATNASIERKGARCGLVTSAGFRDVLELRRRDRPNTYGLRHEYQPLVARADRREVKERTSAEGEILSAVDLAALRVQVQELREAGCEVLVISFLHSYANPANERAAKAEAQAIWHNDYVVISSDVLPAIREFERTSTAVVSGYVQPLIARYLSKLGENLAHRGLQRDLLVVQSNGGVMAAAVAPRFAANTILSGPAAGVTAAATIAKEMGMASAVSCDIGGTSLDICVIRKGRPNLTQQTSLDFGIPLALPMLDVDAIGVGGGSLARVDRVGLLQVGPESAGADPGPACFGRGGSIPTVTDACLLLGYLKPEHAIGKGRGAPMNPDLSARVIEETIGKQLALTREMAAEAILTVAGAKMGGHVRRKLLERGLDPREFSIIAFGGAGPLHANRVLREVGLRSAVVPYYPGITSAMGCIFGELRHDFLKTVNRTMSALSDLTVTEICADFANEGRQLLIMEGAKESSITVSYGGDMCYRGQSNVIPVVFPSSDPSWSAVRSAFEIAYRERYGRLLERAEIVFVNARVTASAQGTSAKSLAPFIRLPRTAIPEPGSTQVFFGGRWQEAKLYDRHALPVDAIVEGPALLLQADTTTFIEPGFAGEVHASGNLVISAVK